MSFRSFLIATTSVLSVSLLMVSTPAIAASKSEPTVALKTQNQAQEILLKAIKAAGGLEPLKSLREGAITVSTRAARIGQGSTPDSDGKLGNVSKTIGRRSGGKTAIERFNDEGLASRYVRGELVDWIYFADQNSVADVEPSLAAGIINQVNSSAHVLLELFDRSENLRSGARVRKNGKRYNTVSYANTLGQQETLYFDMQSDHLYAIERVSAHAQWGDTVTERRFSDYKSSENLVIAHTVSTYQAGILSSETKVESWSKESAPESTFEKPKDATVNDPFTGGSSAPRSLDVETLAENIYFIKDAAQGYNVIFVDQEDGILILETPQSPQASRDVIRTVKAKLPNKPIKGAVPTHHHFDHSGGLYGYLKAGVPIITTPGNVEFVKSVGTANRNIGPNAGSADNISVIDFDDKKHVIGKGDNRVELINVGPNPHAEEIIIMYIPAIDAVFVADIFSRRADTLPPANANQLAFADALETLKLDPKTYIPVHGTNATKAEFWDSVKRGREAAKDDG